MLSAIFLAGFNPRGKKGELVNKKIQKAKFKTQKCNSKFKNLRRRFNCFIKNTFKSFKSF